MTRDGAPDGSPRPLRVLIVEDVAHDADLMVRELRRAGYAPDWEVVEDESAYLAALDRPLDIILSDFALPRFGALRALELLRERETGVPLVVVTGAVGEEMAADCIKRGAADFLLKDHLAQLGTAVEQSMVRRRLGEAEAAMLRAGQIAREIEERLMGVKLAVREVAHLLNNDLAIAVGTLDLLQEVPGLPREAHGSVQTALDALDVAAQHVAKFQRVVRVETQETPLGPALDIERSI